MSKMVRIGNIVAVNGLEHYFLIGERMTDTGHFFVGLKWEEEIASPGKSLELFLYEYQGDQEYLVPVKDGYRVISGEQAGEIYLKCLELEKQPPFITLWFQQLAKRGLIGEAIN
ncbi:MAG: hypothetical protein K5697_08990 [Lachnospiraceae bacterium]|nr:hypothetical protein [Lachnospiraceae bacterium]